MVTDESIKTKRSPLDNFLRPFDLPTLYFTVQKFICVRTPPPNLTNLSSNKIGGLSCLYSRNGLYPCCIMIPNLFNNTVSWCDNVWKGVRHFRHLQVIRVRRDRVSRPIPTGRESTCQHSLGPGFGAAALLHCVSKGRTEDIPLWSY